MGEREEEDGHVTPPDYPDLYQSFYVDMADALVHRSHISDAEGRVKVMAVLEEIQTLLKSTTAEDEESADNMTRHFFEIMSYGNFDELTQFMDQLRTWFKAYFDWPMHAVSPDPRDGTYLANRDEVFVCHNKELLRLVYTNPLKRPPYPVGNYICDKCKCPDIKVSYESVDEDDLRDTATFFEQTIGFDMCVACASDCVQSYHRALLQWIATGTSLPDPQRYQNSLGLAGEIRIDRVTCLGKEMTVQVSGTEGMYVAVRALKPNRTLSDLDWSQCQGTTQDAEALLNPAWKNTTCTICMLAVDEEVSRKGLPVMTDCGHQFHFRCFRHLRRGTQGQPGAMQCPNCRHPVKDESIDQYLSSVSHQTAQLRVDHDSDGNELDPESRYYIVAILCQNPKFLLDTHVAAATSIWNACL